MQLRVVRGKLPTGEFETLLTSLPRDEFSAEEIMELYRMRWREELFFRLCEGKACVDPFASGETVGSRCGDGENPVCL